MIEKIVIFFMCLLVFLGPFFIDWITYKFRGTAQPNPNEENGPIINGPGDATTQRYIDWILRKKKKK